MGKLLITGGMGHVGFETTKQAAQQGIQVVAQYMNTFRKDAAESLGDNVTWVRCDLSDQYELAMLAAEHDIEGCIHTAAIPNDALGLPQPLRTFQSNVVATELLLETARRQKWKRFLFVSTGSVHQDLKDTVNPVLETLQATPKTLYGGTKRAAEIMVEAYANSYDLPAATIRISWIFGPPLVPKEFEGPRGPIPEFLKRALRGETINEPSGGEFSASFTYVIDCAAGLLKAYQAKTLNHSLYHLGSGQNQTTYQVAEAVNKAVPGANVTVGATAAPWTDYTTLRGPLSCERMKDDIGFSPAFTLDEAVADFAKWMRAHPESYQD